ncbi:protein muscleblind-like isoform X8 [Stegodyphus dumicola]|uniref:protein muscleblind-like isoform X8 n=1 Tax=Stegodyphus dumicola TaxID=202533 RepID=UPI0015AD0839|nr:protein muscleblind-like isoform X8 [Stegodyphus dumicola]
MGRCNREKPPCKYFHPPQHLKDQLLINGRNHLALKNAIMQQLPLQPLLQPPAAQLTPAVVSIMNASTTPYMPALAGHTASSFSPYLSPSPMIPAGMMPADALAAPPPPPQLTSIVHTPIVTQKVPRTDRLEPNADAKKRLHDSTQIVQQRPPTSTDNMLLAFPGVSPYSKRPAMEKSGLPVYQPSTAAYQQALAMQVQQPFVPVSYTCLPSAVTGHPTAVPRF